MTNEELCALAKQGDKQAANQLWEQCRKLIAMVFNRMMITPSIADRAAAAGVTSEDLNQEGYFAVLQAIEKYNPAAGVKFTTYLTFHLQSALFSAVGLRTVKGKRDPLTSATRLDAPLFNDNGEEIDQYATIEDTGAAADMLALEEADYIERRHNDLEASIATLNSEEAQVVRHVYYYDMSFTDTARCMGKTIGQVRRLEERGRRGLRSYKSIGRLKKYYNDILSRHTYNGTGFFSWKYSGSVEEKAIERMEQSSLLHIA